MRIGTIGTSGITELFISAAKKQGFVFDTAYSRSAEKAAAFAGKHGMPRSTDDLTAFAKSDAFEAVYIASPNALHYEQARLCLENGKHVLVEKPATATTAQQEALFALADEKGLICAEAIMSIHTPAFETLRRAIEEIGRVRTAHFMFCQLSSRYPALCAGDVPNIFNPALQAGCLMDIGVYNLYLAAALFGRPARVDSAAVFLETGAEAAGSATLSYPDRLVTLVYSKVGQSSGPSEIVGDRGTVRIGSVSQLTGIDLVTADGVKALVPPGLTRDEVMGAEARFFADAVKTGGGDAYRRARETALLVRELTDAIRRDNRFPF